MPSPWITRMVAELDDAGQPADPRDFAPEGQVERGLYPKPTRCQHIQCRKRTQQQDLQCTKAVHGPEVRHYHSIALGYCEERFAKLIGPGSGGRSGGHVNPVIG